MKRYSYRQRLGVVILGLVAFPLLGLGQANLKSLHKHFEKTRKDWNVPGMAIAIVKDGQVVHSEGYGVTDVESDEKVDENTMFAIASNTKAFTSGALAILVDEGKLTWDDKVIKYLPYFELYDPYVTQNMTIRDLLCHRSGLKTFSGDLIWYGSDHDQEEIIRRARFLKPVHAFRTEFGYSNIMYLAAGRIIYEVTGLDWKTFVKRRFFDPLGMERTVTSTNDLKGMDNVAQPHNDVEGENIKIDYLNWDNIAPAGSIISCVQDLSSWIMLQLADGKWGEDQLLSEDQIFEMRKSHTIEGVSKYSRKLFPSKHFNTYGLGWELFDYHGRKIVAHSGGYDGMISRTVLVPEENLGFVILTNNISSLSYVLHLKILDEYLNPDGDNRNWSEFFLNRQKEVEKAKEAMASEDRENRAVGTKPTLKLSEYTGMYESDVYGKAEVLQVNGDLVVQFRHTPIFTGKLTHWHYDVFQIEMTKVPSLPPGKCWFDLGPEGKIVEMHIDIPNPDFDFTELEFKKL